LLLNPPVFDFASTAFIASAAGGPAPGASLVGVCIFYGVNILSNIPRESKHNPSP